MSYKIDNKTQRHSAKTENAGMPTDIAQIQTQFMNFMGHFGMVIHAYTIPTMSTLLSGKHSVIFTVKQLPERMKYAGWDTI